jgi:N,N'-diacetyllegionaminate synthase
MNEMKKMFDVTVGYSDHVADEICAISAIALGAKVYEKHFTIDKNLPGPDHNASIEPEQLKKLIKNIRSTEKSLGNGYKRVMDSEIENRCKLRKYVISKNSINKGDVITAESISVKRTGGVGIVADKYSDVIGRTAKKNINSEQPITEELLK